MHLLLLYYLPNTIASPVLAPAVAPAPAPEFQNAETGCARICGIKIKHCVTKTIFSLSKSGFL